MGAESAIHHAVVAIDIEGFSRRTDTVQAELHDAMYAVAEAAAADAWLDWDGFGLEDGGDSILIYIPASVQPVRLAGPFLRALDDRLAQRARRVSQEYSMRWRVAMHHGQVHRDANGWTGDAVNHTARLLDAQPLREILATALRARLAFIASESVYGDVIAQGHDAIDRAAYRRVRFAAKGGGELSGWVCVPGYPTPPQVAGELPASTPEDPRGGAEASSPQRMPSALSALSAPTTPGPAAQAYHGPIGQNLNGSTVIAHRDVIGQQTNNYGSGPAHPERP